MWMAADFGELEAICDHLQQASLLVLSIQHRLMHCIDRRHLHCKQKVRRMLAGTHGIGIHRAIQIPCTLTIDVLIICDDLLDAVC